EIVVPAAEEDAPIPVAPIIDDPIPVRRAVVDVEIVDPAPVFDDEMISFQCQQCGTTMRVRPEMAGKSGKCKSCQATITVPGGSADEEYSFGESAAAEPVFADDSFSNSVPPGGLAQSRAGGLSPKKQLASIKNMVDAGKYMEATRALKSVQGNAANHPGYFYLSGLTYVGLGNYPHALDNLNRAAAGGMKSPELFAAKGEAELELGHFSTAIDSLDQALDLAGTDVPDYMANLAKAYDGARMRQDARATWAALAQISPNHPALIERKRSREERRSRKHDRDVQGAMVQMQKEQRASDTACWICIILRCLCECM
ncbi:MAG: hypothetical protein IID45_05520, partial [Planctomycetes bacterium]|nr:hypothetical protein [Planctomycetota bacterium]